MQGVISTATGRMLASLLLLVGLMLPATLSHATSAPPAMAAMPGMDPGMDMGCNTPSTTAPDRPISCHPPSHHDGHAGDSCCPQGTCAAAWLPAPTAQAPPALRRVASVQPIHTHRLAGRICAPGLRPPRNRA
ncbi:hypothetical protein [Gluconacetobacter tumulicola]|uniref:CopL family metal-binding regulatory protein n=1 Tax=Gluconacetobacter tumulicola TaxID=1017177 RepID=A0A7W4P775_9PROT|nr:hypothetical protein [Gluconacetobacter tumulicola]MBB2179669.1 hypothetical protein [Gluconacetobacter tumulicola]